VSDLILIMDHDPESLSVLRSVADRLGCERVEAESTEQLKRVLASRNPTIAVLAIDMPDADGLAALRALADRDMLPATFLLGSSTPRVLTSAKRAAQSRGLSVVGTSSRPVDATKLEQVLTSYLTAAPPIPRQELEQALAEHELTLLYQPKIALLADSVSVQGVEALVRWQHPRRGSLRPAHFLRAIEHHGLMMALTDFVMTEAVRQCGQWRAQGIPLQTVVNLSPRLVRDPAFPARLHALLREHAVPPEQLAFDIAEPSSAEDHDLMLEVFTNLRILGVGLSLDNFGTGRSSLTELYRMPYSEIKVDHSLVADGPTDGDAERIISAITELAHTLRLSVCAAGVETRPMFEFVRGVGFDSAQGHFFSGPVHAGLIEQFVKDWPRSAPSTTGTWRSLRSATDPTIAKTARHVKLRGM
jgi:EAL domain-containing protein (putative c-di-GMP-specific phosphodiesterase class I)